MAGSPDLATVLRVCDIQPRPISDHLRMQRRNLPLQLPTTYLYLAGICLLESVGPSVSLPFHLEVSVRIPSLRQRSGRVSRRLAANEMRPFSGCRQ